jgi:hypothetical protein
MSFEEKIQSLDGGRILAECGPMRLVIEAWIGRIPQRDQCVRAAKEAFVLLGKIARQRDIVSRRYAQVPGGLDDFQVLKMIRSVVAVDKDLTPMAAVAGTISDGVASFLSNRGMTRVIVNNGGDLAVRTGSGGAVKVGIRPDLTRSEITHAINLGDERPRWGIATSGLEGRSLTRGVASAATVIAGSASVADAAATSVANSSYIDDETVLQRPAQELDGFTDIPGVAVTVQAGPFPEEKKEAALSGALQRANTLIQKGLIYGACVAVDGKVAMTDFVRRRLVQLS